MCSRGALQGGWSGIRKFGLHLHNGLWDFSGLLFDVKNVACLNTQRRLRDHYELLLILAVNSTVSNSVARREEK